MQVERVDKHVVPVIEEEVLGSDFAVAIPSTNINALIEGLRSVAALQPSAQMTEEANRLIELLQTEPRWARDAELLGNDEVVAIRIQRKLKWKANRAKVSGCNGLRLLTWLAALASTTTMLPYLQGSIFSIKQSGIPIKVRPIDTTAIWKRLSKRRTQWIRRIFWTRN
jgi:hypothetical protein